MEVVLLRYPRPEGSRSPAQIPERWVVWMMTEKMLRKTEVEHHAPQTVEGRPRPSNLALPDLPHNRSEVQRRYHHRPDWSLRVDGHAFCGKQSQRIPLLREGGPELGGRGL